MSEVRCPECAYRQDASRSRCLKCKARLPDEEPDEREDSEEEGSETGRSGAAPFRQRAAWIGLAILVLALVSSSTAFLLKARGVVPAGTAAEVAVLSLTAAFFVGIPCLLVPVIARIADVLKRRQRLSSALYRLLMFVVGNGFVALCLYRFSQGAYAGAIGVGVLAVLCLWYGAVRGENPDVR